MPQSIHHVRREATEYRVSITIGWLGRELLLEEDEKLYELAKRGQALAELADKQSIEAAIRAGQGGLFLKLTPEQYQKLERK